MLDGAFGVLATKLPRRRSARISGKTSSIVHSNNRCIAVHGSNHKMIRGIFAFDTVGHRHFLEDGIESGNTFEHNIGFLTRSASAHDEILPSDLKPATFWITNPNNVVRANIAAGSDGMGFWYNLSTASDDQFGNQDLRAFERYATEIF